MDGQTQIAPRINSALSSASDVAILIDRLRVQYGELVAVRDISFEVRRGEIFGLLGRNGAGKTSAISTICGLRIPTAGAVTVFGVPVGRPADVQRLHTLLALQPQQASLFPRLRVRETLEMWAALYPRPRNVNDLIATLGLGEKERARAATLSGGQRQRLLLATALVGGTPLAVLDEPTTGLDPHARREVWELIRRVQHEGTTVVLSTHGMAEAEEMCDRMAILHDGVIVASGTPGDLIREHAPGGCVSVRTTDPGLVALLRERFGDRCTSAGEATTRADIMADEPHAVAAWITRRHPAADVRARSSTLEDVFLRVTGTAPESTEDTA
jgi:ABC-2 type transport system ATP-binding protein